jgi:hypothetical protein
MWREAKDLDGVFAEVRARSATAAATARLSAATPFRRSKKEALDMLGKIYQGKD